MKYMKRILLFIACLLSYTAFSQTVIINNDINKFVGTWRWTSGSDTVEIVLEKQVYVIPLTGSHTEDLVGWHRYVKNGSLLQSSLQYVGRDVNIDFNSNSLDMKTTLHGSSYQNNPNEVFFTRFWDLSLHKNFELFFTMLPNSTTQVNWVLKQPRGIYVGPPGLNGIYSLPKQLTLTKL